jgi:flagellar hook-length control protein FliK
MNIEGVSSLSLLPANTPIEGEALPLLENGVLPVDFTNALIEQVKLLSKANGQPEIPVQLPATTMVQPIEDLKNIADSLISKNDQKELLTLLETYLPTSYKTNLKNKEDESVDVEAALLALTDALKAVVPNMPPEEVTTAKDMSGVMTLNGLSSVKPMPAETDLNTSGAGATPEGTLQKETNFRQSIQSEQGFNLQSIENTESAKQPLVLEKQPSLLGSEKTVPSVTTEMPPVYRPIDNRIDSPVITKPLTHPDWSKNLGEQIVWMHNKEIAAAEIKLNPAHLGPISVRIDVNQDQQATIMFTAQHLETKEALEASIPKLREMLFNQQLNLVNVNISQNSTPDHGRPQSFPFQNPPENRDQNIENAADAIEKNKLGQVVVNKGLLSIYA